MANKPEKQEENRPLMEAGKATRWKPDQSGNPSGRPAKRECLTSLLKEEIEKVNPEDREGAHLEEAGPRWRRYSWLLRAIEGHSKKCGSAWMERSNKPLPLKSLEPTAWT